MFLPMKHLIALIIASCIGCASGCSSAPRKSDKIKETVYLEVHVFADHGYMEYFKNDATKAQNYLFRFMHSVSWRFMYVFFSVRFPIVNITLLNETGDKEIFGAGKEEADASDAIQKFKDYLEKHYKHRNSDLVYLLTSRNLYVNGRGPGTKIKVAGMVGNDGGVCTQYNIALGIDKPGKYTGFLWAVRQIAKLMGAKDDGDQNTCLKHSGYLMSNHEKQPMYNHFSTCSEDAMEANLSEKPKSCTGRSDLKDLNPGASIGIAGQNLTLRERCQAFFGEDKWSCREKVSTCITTCCTEGQWYHFTWPAIGVLPTADGQTCHSGWNRCYNGYCLQPDSVESFQKEYSGFIEPSNPSSKDSP